MMLLAGSDAYSPFRLDAIREAIARLCPDLDPVEIDAKWVYALQGADGAFAAEDLQRASSLLNATGECLGADFFVTPRKGTISPWSSKATDIFRNCGLKSILRVERGIRYQVSGLASKVLAARPEVAPYQDGSEDVEPVKAFVAPKWAAALYDKMTEGVYGDIADLFDVDDPRPGRTYDVMAKGVEAIKEANEEIGLAISEPEMKYLAQSFKKAGRNPTDTELVMFGQVNSEHCRHKIFGGTFIIDGEEKESSLFQMIKKTTNENPNKILSAYKDNVAFSAGPEIEQFSPADHSQPDLYQIKKVKSVISLKAETHSSSLCSTIKTLPAIRGMHTQGSSRQLR